MNKPIIEQVVRDLVPADAGDGAPWHLPGPCVPESYAAFTSAGGGGYTSDGMFHFFGGGGPEEHDVRRWQAVAKCQGLFGVDPAWAAVAEDVYGNQFCVRTDGRRPVIKMLSLWTGEFSTVAGDFEAFLRDIVLPTDIWKPLRDRFRRIVARPGMEFRRFAHLSPTPPPCLGGTTGDDAFEWTPLSYKRELPRPASSAVEGSPGRNANQAGRGRRSDQIGEADFLNVHLAPDDPTVGTGAQASWPIHTLLWSPALLLPPA
jgi:hypothetical protein